jgi:hypothetical protein
VADLPDRAVQPEAPTTEAGRRFVHYADNVQRAIHPLPRTCKEPEACDLILEAKQHVLAIEAEARAASQERPQPDPEPKHTEGQGEMCDPDCPHWAWSTRRPQRVAQERPRPDTDGALRAALVRLIAAQDVNASVGERMAATTAARAALAGEEQWNNESPESGATATGSSATSAPFVDPKWRRANGLPPVPPRKPLAQKRGVRGDIQDRGRRDSL